MDRRVQMGYWQEATAIPGFGINDDDVTFFTLPDGTRKYLTDNLDRNPYTDAIKIPAVAADEDLSTIALVAPYDGNILRVSIMLGEALPLEASDPGPLEGREWQLVRTVDDTVIASAVYDGDTIGGVEIAAGRRYDLDIPDSDLVEKGEAFTVKVLAVPDSSTVPVAVPESFVVVDWLDPLPGDALNVPTNDFTPSGAGDIIPPDGGEGPFITGFTPTHGQTAQPVTVSGVGFTGQAGSWGKVNTLTFDGPTPGSFVVASFAVVNDTTIVAVVPDGAATGKIRLHSQGTVADIISVSPGTFTVDPGVCTTCGPPPTTGPSVGIQLTAPAINGSDLQSFATVTASEAMQKLTYQLKIGKRSSSGDDFIAVNNVFGEILVAPGKTKNTVINTGTQKLGGSTPPALIHKAELIIQAEFKGGVVIKKKKTVTAKHAYEEGFLVRDHAAYQVWINPPFRSSSGTTGSVLGQVPVVTSECTVVVKVGTLYGGGFDFLMDDGAGNSMKAIAIFKYGTRGSMAWCISNVLYGAGAHIWKASIPKGKIDIIGPRGQVLSYDLGGLFVEDLLTAGMLNARASGSISV